MSVDFRDIFDYVNIKQIDNNYYVEIRLWNTGYQYYADTWGKELIK